MRIGNKSTKRTEHKQAKPAKKEEKAARPKPKPGQEHAIQEGDHLEGIAREALGPDASPAAVKRYEGAIARANGLQGARLPKGMASLKLPKASEATLVGGAAAQVTNDSKAAAFGRNRFNPASMSLQQTLNSKLPPVQSNFAGEVIDGVIDAAKSVYKEVKSWFGDETSAKPTPILTNTSSKASKAMSKLHDDGKITPEEAKQAVKMAQEDSALQPGDKSEKNVLPALTNLYVRSGVPVKEAERIAKKTLELSNNPKAGDIHVDKTPQPFTEEDRGRLRARAESDVSSNTERDKPWSMAQLKSNPEDFVRNMSQIDGDHKTDTDQSACAGVSLMGGMILKDPAKAQEMAEKMLSPEGQKQFPEMQRSPQKEALERMKAGVFTPKDASTVGRALVDGSQYDKRNDDNKLEKTRGMPVGRQMAMIGRLRKIGFQMPPMRQETYGTPKSRNGVHVTAYADGKGYDPWPYPGTGGQGTVTKGEDALREHGLKIGPRLGLNNQERVMNESMTYEDNGDLTVRRGCIDGKTYDPPATARYSFKDGKWERVSPKDAAPHGNETRFPKTIPIDASARSMPVEHDY